MTHPPAQALGVRLWSAPSFHAPTPESGDGLVLSPEALPEPWLLTTATIESPQGDAWVDGLHAVHELIWSGAGALTVEVGEQLWMVPSGLGIWIPAGVAHHVRAEPGTVTLVTYFHPARVAPAWAQSVTGITLGRALHELILHNKSAMLAPEVRLRVQQVVVDLLTPVESASLDIRMPVEPWVRAVAEAILANPADDRTLTQWADTLNVSARTLSRAFLRETGLTLTRWRILVRVRQALIEIASGRSVTAVAGRLGYANPSTFTDLFRQTLGQTPAAYFRSFDSA